MACFTVSLYGQGKENYREKIREAKIEFIKKKLALTETEEKKFLPLYNKFLDESEALRKNSKKNINLAEVDLTFMSDEECEKLINDVTEQKQKEVDLINKYTAEFKKVLPIKKVAMIFKVEHEFKKVLVRKLRRHRSKEMREKSEALRKEMSEVRKEMHEKRKEMHEKRKQLREEYKAEQERLNKERERISKEENKSLEKLPNDN